MNYKILDSYLPESEKQYYESSNPGWEINTTNCFIKFLGFRIIVGAEEIERLAISGECVNPRFPGIYMFKFYEILIFFIDRKSVV